MSRMSKKISLSSLLFGLLNLLLLNACGDVTATSTPTQPNNTAMTATTSDSMMTTSSAMTSVVASASTVMAMAQPTTAPATTKSVASLPVLRKAPDWNNQNWLNSQPLTLADLRGKVVLVEFWTFECINCQHVMPAMRQYYDEFKDSNFALISFHDPEFSTERDWNNVQQAVKEDNIKYAVAQDNDFKTWNAFGVNAWPTWFLIDKQGNIRYKHIGEGAYDETEANIKALLAEQPIINS